ncbi:MAG: asparaginase [Rhodospirillaceae bacterium]
MSPDPNPILVEVVRGETVESAHRGAACIVDSSGRLLHAWGDVDRPICPRSAIKPFQAIPLVESGAADAAALGEEELALACASHGGEAVHVARIGAWLSRIRCSTADLECGTHLPSNAAAAEALLRRGESPCPLHHNCSGKHTGFLTLARHAGWPTKGYTNADHPVQTGAIGALATMALTTPGPVVRDGCSAANVFLPLTSLAAAWARLGTTPASRRLIEAMKAHPVLMSGHGHSCATMIGALAGAGVVKTGAEGIYAGVLPERGLGVAVKIDDGASRAAAIAIASLLTWLDAFKSEDMDAIQALRAPAIRTNAGALAGRIQAVRDWLT